MWLSTMIPGGIRQCKIRPQTAPTALVRPKGNGVQADCPKYYRRKIQKLQDAKQNLAEQIISGDMGQLGSMSREDILELL